MVQDETTGARLLHVGEKFAQFTPAPMAAPRPGEAEAPRYGVYETTDPEAQASLEKYVAEGGEILSEEEFKRRTTRPEDVIAALKTLKDAVLAGELDAQIEAASGALKAGFEK